MLKVGFDVVFGFRQGQLGGAGEPKGAHAINQPKVDGFGVPALVFIHLFQRDVINRGGGGGMNILPLAERFQHGFILRNMRHDAQFNLRIVNRDQPGARRGDKALTHASAKLRPRGDVLQVRILRGNPPGGGARLIERGVNSTGSRVDLQGESVHVSGFQFGQLAKFQDFVNNRVLPAHAFQHSGGSGQLARAGLARAVGRFQAQALKKHIRELLGGIEIERFAYPRVNRILNALDLFVQLQRKICKQIQVQQDAFLFHIRQHRDKLHLQVAVQLLRLMGNKVCPERFHQAQAHHGIRRGIRRGLSNRDLRHANLFFAAANQFFDMGHIRAQAHPCQVFQPQVARIGVYQPFGNHGIKAYWRHLIPGLLQANQVIFGVVPDFVDARVFQQGLQRLEDLLWRQLFALRVPEREVITFGRVRGQRDAHQFRPHWVCAGCFGIKSQQVGARQFRGGRLQGFGGVHNDGRIVFAAAENLHNRGGLFDEQALLRGVFQAGAQFAYKAAQALGEGAELELAEEVFHGGGIKAVNFGLGQVKTQLQVGADARQILAEVGGFSSGSQGCAGSAADFVQMPVDIIQVFVFFQQAHGCLLADAFHARDIVRNIPDQGFVIHHLPGQNAQFALDVLGEVVFDRIGLAVG